MSLGRRDFMKAALCFALGAAGAIDLGADTKRAFAESWQNPVVYYRGPDDVEALRQKAAEMSRDKPLVLMYYRDGCEACDQMTDDMYDLGYRMPGAFTVLKVDIQNFPSLAETARVRVTPESYILSRGQPVGPVMRGWGPPYLAMIERYIGGERSPSARPPSGFGL